MQVLYPSKAGIWGVDFCGGRKTGEPKEHGEKPLEQEENQQQTQLTYGTRPRSNWDQSFVGREHSHHYAIPAPC